MKQFEIKLTVMVLADSQEDATEAVLDLRSARSAASVLSVAMAADAVKLVADNGR